MNKPEKVRILVVDDEPQVLVALEDLLSDDFAILKSSSPTEALEVMRARHDIAVVLTDQRMPAMTGDRLLAHIERVSQALGIMITGFADLNAVVRAVNEGRLFAYVTKPWDSEDLRFKVHQAAERFRLTQELANERRLLHDLMDNVPDGIYFKDRDQKLIRANTAYAKSVGLADASALQAPEVQAQAVSASQREIERQVLETGIAATDQVCEREIGGRRRWISETIAPIRNTDSNVVGLVCIARDVTGRMEVEEALRQSELELRDQTQLLMSILESMSEGVVAVDRAGRFVLCNDQAEKLLGTALTKSSARNWTSDSGLYHSNRSTPVVDYNDPLARALQHQEVSTLEVSVENERVRGVSLLITAAPLRRGFGSNQELGGAVAVLRDITRERELEHQFMHSQKMEAVGRLAGGIAHDFNNLLSVIQSCGEILLMQMDEDPRRLDVEEIMAAGERAANLTRQLLTFSRSGIVQPHSLQLNAVIDGFDRILQRTLGEDIRLVTNLDPDLPVIASDVGQLEQVILNLAVNARDALPDGGRLSITTRRATREEIDTRFSGSARHRDYVVMIVEDTGTGMSDDVRAQIFEPFFTTKQVGKGTGIGLSTVYGIVHKYSGAIWVTSQLGVGSAFYVAFPTAVEDALRPVVHRSVSLVNAPGKTILLVEDEDDVRRIAARILREEGYLVLEAANADEAVAACESNPVDLVLADVILSGGNGIELAELLTKRFTRLQTLFMSGYPGDRVPGLHLIDEDTYLEKPLTRKKLLAHVSRVLIPQSGATGM